MSDAAPLATYYSPLDLQTVRAKLSSQIQPFTPPTLLSREETHLPHPVLKVEGDDVELTQQKTYVNPWECRLKGLLTAHQGGTRLELSVVRSTFLRRWNMLEWFTAIATVAGIAEMTRQTFSTHASWLSAAFPSVGLLALWAMYAQVVKQCKRQFQSYSQNERPFLMNFLIGLLNLREETNAGPSHESTADSQRIAV